MLYPEFRGKNVVVLARASSDKQASFSDTLRDQYQQLHDVVVANNGKIVKTFPLAETGADDERHSFGVVLNYCKDPKNKVDFLFFLEIGRFTRGGSGAYDRFKTELANCGVEIRDLEGIIQKKRNTMANLSLEFPSWSVYYPSAKAELSKAEEQKENRRNILTKMIGAEVRYTRAGFWCRPSPLGFDNKRIEIVGVGKRTILIPSKKEASWVITMLEMRAAGIYEGEEIVEKVNRMGFKTRLIPIREKGMPSDLDKIRKIIGYRGGNPLTVKSLKQIIKRPIYAGVVANKYTHGKPVKAQFDGLVSVEIFNKANRGKVVLIEKPGGSLEIEYNKKEHKYSRNIAKYPYKKYILCPICYRNLKASASRSGSGVPSPRYHCSCNHKYFSVSKSELEARVLEFVGGLGFDVYHTELFKAIFLDVVQEKRNTEIDKATYLENRVKELEVEIKTCLDRFVIAKLDTTAELMEERLANLNEGKTKLMQQKENIEVQEQTVSEQSLELAVQLMERPKETLLSQENPINQAAIFGLFFNSSPTYLELKDGTVDLSPVFRLNGACVVGKDEMVRQVVSGWNGLVASINRIANTLKGLSATASNSNYHQALTFT